jgi:hypothetical protein
VSEFAYGSHEPGLEGIAVHVDDDGGEIGVVLDCAGPVAILEDVADVSVPFIEVARVAGHEPRHESRQLGPRHLDDEVEVVPHQSPCEAADAAFVGQALKALYEVLAVRRVEDYELLADAAMPNVMSEAGSVDARAARQLWTLAGPVGECEQRIESDLQRARDLCKNVPEFDLCNATGGEHPRAHRRHEAERVRVSAREARERRTGAQSDERPAHAEERGAAQQAGIEVGARR